MFDVSWYLLKEKSPINITDLVNVAESIELDIMSLKSKVAEPRFIFQIKGKLFVLLGKYTDLFLEDGFISNKNKFEKELDAKSLGKIYQNISRLVGKLDALEKDVATKRIGLLDFDFIMPFLSEMESILYRDVYFIIKRAIERSGNDRRKFMYNILQITQKNVEMFGGEERFKPTLQKGTKPFLVDESLSEEGQKKMAEEYKEEDELYLKSLEKTSKRK